MFSPWWLLAIAVSGTALLAWAYWGGWNIHPHANAGELGQLGDFFGGMLNPLVSALTLFVAISVWRLQKDELELTRKELENSRLAVEEQAATAEQQRKEQRFFDFLNLYQVTLETISFEERTTSALSAVFGSEKPTTSPVTRTGKSAFKLLTSSWASPIRSLSTLFVANNENSDPMPAEETIIKSWDRQSPLLDHYFRTVFTLLREAKPILKNDHFRFVKLFRAQLSRDEVNLLAMNLLYDEEGQKMRDLVASYGILKHMPANHLRTIAERDLDPLSFGRKWAEKHLASTQATPC
nr:putative phage abortive infection protein [Rhodoferax sp. U2-2l]